MPRGLQALIASGDAEMLERIEKAVVRLGLRPVKCSTVSQSQALLMRQPICVVFCEQFLSDGSFRDVMDTMQAIGNAVPVVVLNRHSNCEQYLEVINSGAFDYLTRSCSNVELARVVARALQSVSVYA